MVEEILEDKEVYDKSTHIDAGREVCRSTRDWMREITIETRKTMETWRNRMGDE